MMKIKKKKNEWFSSIKYYSDAFKERVKKWIQEYLHEKSNKLSSQTNISEQPPKEIIHVAQVPVKRSKDLSAADPPVSLPTV